jgi:molybdate transport system substrate-binding protein
VSAQSPSVIPLLGITSMATRQLLRALAEDYGHRTGQPVECLSMGGVEVLRRVQEGERFDLIVLASDAIDRLLTSGHVIAGSRVDIARSSVAAAIKAGAPRPDISREEALRDAVLAAPSIGYSTGPSGTGLLLLLQRWGIDQQVRPRLVQATPGVPVGSLVAEGAASLGFQQYSELQGIAGIELLGTLPETCAIRTIFSAAICAASTQPAVARRLLQYLGSAETAAIKQRYGMASA